MGDFRGKLCRIDGRVTARCIAQNFILERLYFELPKHLHHFDCGFCDIPSFVVRAALVEIMEEEES